MFIHPVTQQLLTEFLGCGTKLVKNADKTPCISGREMTEVKISGVNSPAYQNVTGAKKTQGRRLECHGHLH